MRLVRTVYFMGIPLTDADGEVVDSGANQFAPSFLRFSVIVRDYRRLSTLSVRVAILWHNIV